MTVEDLIMKGCDSSKFRIVMSPTFYHSVVHKMLYVEIKKFDAALRNKINYSKKVYIYENDDPRSARLSFPDDDFEVDFKVRKFEEYYDNY